MVRYTVGREALEQLADVADRVFAGGVHLEELALLEVGQLGRPAGELTLVPGELQSFAGAQADEAPVREKSVPP